MRTSRIVTFAMVIAIAASALGAALFLTNTNDAAKSTDATALPTTATATLDPVVVEARR